MTATKPTVLWFQTSSTISATDAVTLNVEIADVDAVSVQCDATSTSLTFKARDANGHEYAFELEFFAEIESEWVENKASRHGLSVTLPKHAKGQKYWPRLTKSTERPSFLKVDAARWIDEDGEGANELANDDGFLDTLR
ncbi:p23/wos2 family protein [Kitasatospora sp. NPDC098663]|uniref:p23/wos2 family protein n=1 Tax=Kitasatospora sp. NPDC098663 TaxID=3364096 RepID=UPI003825A6C4